MNEYKSMQKEMFLEGIQRFKGKGVLVSIDGKEFVSEDYEKLLEVREDGSFYMGDYIESDAGILAEIHFDKVYYK